jgi:hypothetical protein
MGKVSVGRKVAKQSKETGDRSNGTCFRPTLQVCLDLDRSVPTNEHLVIHFWTVANRKLAGSPIKEKSNSRIARKPLGTLPRPRRTYPFQVHPLPSPSHPAPRPSLPSRPFRIRGSTRRWTRGHTRGLKVAFVACLRGRGPGRGRRAANRVATLRFVKVGRRAFDTCET